jgi:sulfur relay (sulfurtransferase) DsrF/TusC family protein
VHLKAPIDILAAIAIFLLFSNDNRSLLVVKMPFKLLIVASCTGFRLDFAKQIAVATSKSSADAGIAFVGNSIYNLRKRATKSMKELEGISLMAHEMSMVERGIAKDELVVCVKMINDDELLELMISSEKTLCV